MSEESQTTTTKQETTAQENVPEEVRDEAQKETVEQAPAVPVKNYDDLVPGMTVRVHQKIKDVNKKGEEKERVQAYEGLIIARRHGKQEGATIIVRKVTEGVGVEKIFPLKSPTIQRIDIVKAVKVRRAKLYFVRKSKKKLHERVLAAA